MISSLGGRCGDNRQPPINPERARWITIDKILSCGGRDRGTESQRLGRRAMERQRIKMRNIEKQRGIV
jgi:hypothetical protein